jgi:hypothetical protein
VEDWSVLSGTANLPAPEVFVRGMDVLGPRKCSFVCRYTRQAMILVKATFGIEHIPR